MADCLEMHLNSRSDPSASMVEDDKLQPLKIVVVGAGIGGLTTAIYLRKQGHTVTVLEQSRFANEVGAAVHLAPNANGILRRVGVDAETFGGNELCRFTNFSSKGDLVASWDNTARNSMWQNKYLLVHRVRLHEALKLKATSKNWPGTPIELRTSSRVLHGNPSAGLVTLENGTVIQGDVVIGADGVHSKMRTGVAPDNIRPYSSGKNAFRFLLPRSALLESPQLAKYARVDGELIMWHGPNKRVIMYPCNNNTMLNFVAIHPAEETNAQLKADEYNNQGRKEILLKVFSEFDPVLLELISKVNEATLKLWSLLDMKPLPSWTTEKLVLLGDAAHPYTPHQGQGAGQAMEDGAALAVTLPLGTKPQEVPERLQLFQKLRYDRATRIQQFSRMLGEDSSKISEEERRNETLFQLSHDAWDSAIHQFRQWMWSKNFDTYWRMPTSFGPTPGPRQDFYGRPRDGSRSVSTSISIKFKTSRTFLDGLLPNDRFSFTSPATVATASFTQITLDKLDWLGGGGYNIFQLILHGVQYRKRNNEVIRGDFIPLRFEDLADPIISGCEELGFPKVFAQIDVHRRATSVHAQLSWRGAVFGTMAVEGLHQATTENVVQNGGPKHPPGGELPPDATLTWRIIPHFGAQGRSETAYCAMTPFPRKQDLTETPLKFLKAKEATMKWDPLDWDALPTTHHIISTLAEMPIIEVLGGSLRHTTGVSNMDSKKRID